MKIAFAALVLIVSLAACSVEQGGTILQPKPSGVVQVYLIGGSGGALASSKKHPIVVHNAFSLNVTESWYTNYFTAKVISWTIDSPEPCYQVPSKPENTIMTFKPLSGGGCYPGNGDVEGISIADIYGHNTIQYFVNK
jgi:hypothetical protein